MKSLAPLTLVLPDDFRRALRRSRLEDFFHHGAFVHRAGYLRWITDARRRETRERKIHEAIRRLAAERAALIGGADRNDRSGPLAP